MATKLDLAHAQFVGFHHGKWNRSTIIRIVESMGLTKKEWIKMKKIHPIWESLSDEEVKEIDRHFSLV